jgi:response regulator RpfG family c-di-GMP phosphodiesterase
MTETGADRLVKFLLVDDIEANLLALEGLLKRPGLHVLKAHSGAEALELLLVHEVALALLDVQMPEMDGFELARLMRGAERTRHVPIIFVTAGSADQQRRFDGYDAGAVDFLVKPIEAHILRSKANVFFELDLQREKLREKSEELRRSNEELEHFNRQMVGRELRMIELKQEVDTLRRQLGMPSRYGAATLDDPMAK